MARYTQFKIRVNGIERVYPAEKYRGYDSRLAEFLTETRFNFSRITDELHFQWCCRDEGGDWSCWFEDSVKVKRSVTLDFGHTEFTIDE